MKRKLFRYYCSFFVKNVKQMNNYVQALKIKYKFKRIHDSTVHVISLMNLHSVLNEKVSLDEEKSFQEVLVKSLRSLFAYFSD